MKTFINQLVFAIVVFSLSVLPSLAVECQDIVDEIVCQDIVDKVL